MRKILLEFIIFMFIVWCCSNNTNIWSSLWNNAPLEKDIINSSFDEELLYSSNLWYSWDFVIITLSNSWDIVKQTWESLLYVNKNIWFQILLWKEWENSLIVQEKNEHALWTSYSNYSINFKKYSPFLDDYETIIWLSLFPFELYEIYLDMVDNDVYESREDIYKRVIGKNNKYVFIINTINVWHEWINWIFPNLCNEETTKDNLKRRECWNRLNKIFTWYLITDL
jgi:hypothetical protein